MKKLLVIAIALFAIGSVYAQTFNPSVPSDNKIVTTKIITPLTIDVISTAPRDFGNLIQGQTRTFTTPTPIALFVIHREVDQGMWLKVFEPTVGDTKSGVTLITKVLRYTGDWTDGSGIAEFTPGTQLQWDTDGGSTCNVAMVVKTASATMGADLGAHLFKDRKSVV